MPNTVNNNTFDTTGGTEAVNERAISETNYKQDATSNSPGATQDYTLQTASGGDVDISGNTLVARNAWVWAKRGNGSTTVTAAIIDNGGTINITLTTTSTLFDNNTDSSTYPSNADGIGMRAIEGGADTFFYEGGTLIASLGDPVPEAALVLVPLAFVAPKIIKSIQKGTLVEDIRTFLRRILEMIKRMFAGAQSARVRKSTSREIKKEKARRRRKRKKDG